MLAVNIVLLIQVSGNIRLSNGIITLYENKVKLKHDLIPLFVSPGVERSVV
jgi:hypothetical protein